MDSNKLKLELVHEISNLLEQKLGMVEYLKLKLLQEDWHGVADAAMDIREIVSKKIALNDTLEKL